MCVCVIKPLKLSSNDIIFFTIFIILKVGFIKLEKHHSWRIINLSNHALIPHVKSMRIVMKNNAHYHHKDLTNYDSHIQYIDYNRDRHLP